MKTMKRLGCILLVVAMCLALGVSAMAEEVIDGPFTITISAQESGTIDSLDGYTFAAYQIFSGTVVLDDDGETYALEHITWGSAIADGGAFITALKADATIGAFFENCSTAQDVADVLAGWSDGSFMTSNGTWSEANSTVLTDAFAAAVQSYIISSEVTATATAEGSGTSAVFEGLAGGYYLILNTQVPTATGSESAEYTENGQEGLGAYTNPILKMTQPDDAAIVIKADVPSVKKEIVDNDTTEVSGATDADGSNLNAGSEDGSMVYTEDQVTNNTENEAIGDVGDYSIGTEIWFQLTGTFPSDYATYDDYKMIFHDVESDGLTFCGADDVTIYVDVNGDGELTKVDVDKTNAKNSGNISILTGEGVSEGSEEGACTFEVSIQNTMELYDQNGTLIETTSASKIVVQYKSELNSNAVIGNGGNPNDVYLEFSNHGNNNGTGKTKPDKVIGFTYQLDVNKVDGDDDTKPLEGASFILYRVVDESSYYVAVLDDDGKVTGWVSADSAPDSTWTDPTILAENTTTIFTTDENGSVSVIGLDEGTYYLLEIDAPEGYNMLSAPVKITITATYEMNASGDMVIKDLQVQVDDGTATSGDTSKGTVSVDIENNKGDHLPSTGGIGTTIFYIVGAVLVCGAVVLLVTRKRVGKEEG